MKLKNIPNILSCIRILMVPLFTYLFFLNYPNNIYFALMIFLLAGLTDIVDGYLARKNNWITNVGKLLDPLADKFMQCSVLICLAVKDIIPYWLVIIFILKEIFMVFGAIFVFKKIKVTVSSHWYGKISTSLVYISIVILTLFRENISEILKNILLTLVLVFALFSLVMYIIDTVNINKNLKNIN